MKGYRTFAFGLGIAVVPAALTYLAGVDWTSLGLSPTAGALIGAAVISLRTVTNTALGQK